jgi:hypothetical protein
MRRVTRARPELTFTSRIELRSQRQRVRPAFCGASMLPRTDEDFDAALDEFDRIFRRIPPQRGLITTWAVESSEPRASNQFAPRPSSLTPILLSADLAMDAQTGNRRRATFEITRLKSTTRHIKALVKGHESIERTAPMERVPRQGGNRCQRSRTKSTYVFNCIHSGQATVIQPMGMR